MPLRRGQGVTDVRTVSLWDDPRETAARVVIAGLFLGLAYHVALDAVATGRPSGVLLVASELLVVVLTLGRRPAVVVDRSWWGRAVTLVSMVGPLLVRPGPDAGSDLSAVAISSLGLSIVIAGKVALGRSLGLLPAHRGLVRSGLYRVVRHPIYVGYLISHLGFLLAHPMPWNGMLFLAADVALVARALVEERTLSADPDYRRYVDLVRWRLVPGMY